MINTNARKIAALKAENETLKQDVAELKARVAASEEKEEEQHADVQQSLIGEFKLSQEDFNRMLVEGMNSPAVVDFMSRMIGNAMAMGLGR